MDMNINLLPWRIELQLKKIFYFKLQLLVTLAVAVSILILWHVKLQQKINVDTKKINFLQLQQKRIIERKQDENKLQQQQQALNHIKELEQQQLKFVRFFESMHQALPANIYFEQLSIKNYRAKITGRSKTIAELKLLITKFIQAKGAVVPIVQKIRHKSDSYDFVLECGV